jgi:hypothetical protein
MTAMRLTTSFSAEEILLENVELILEAFDYLQLPFALKTGMIYDPTWTVWPGAVNTTFAISSWVQETMCSCKF